MDLLNTFTLLEIPAALFSICYSLLLMRENSWGWPFGIASSVLSVVLFFHTRLYAQAIISIYYAGIGVYGWLYWKKAAERREHIHMWSLNRHVLFVALFAVLSLLTGYAFAQYTDAASPYLDATLTVFGFLASIKEARKVLTSWIYWLVINVLSAWLYYTQDLYFYAALTVVYAGICIPGYLNWRRLYLEHPIPVNS